MTVVPIRNDNAYFGFGLQSGQGVAIAPNEFPRWLDGSTIEFDMKAEDIWEGDGSRMLSQVIKNMQAVKIKIQFNPRPVELGYFEKMSMGTGSDTVGTILLPFATTTSATITANVTTSVLLSGIGTLSPSTQYALAFEPGTANEEIALVTTGPSGNTVTVVASYNGGTGTFKLSHASGTTHVISAVPHTLINKQDGDYYTTEVCLGGLFGGAGPTLRVRDCKVDQIKRSGKAGQLLTYEVQLVGIATVSTGSPATVTLENRPAFFYTTGAWTLNGATTGDAKEISMWDTTQKNNLDTTIQSESLTLDALIYGNINVDVAIDVIFQNAGLINLTYFGSATGTTDAQAIGSGALIVLFTEADTFHSVQYTTPTLHYTKTGMPAPKKDGKHYALSMSASSVSNAGQNAYVLQTLVSNSQVAAY